MKPKLPFPYWLWKEIILTKPPHARLTIFRFITVCVAFTGAALGFVFGRRLAGTVLGIIAACTLFFLGAFTSYFLFRWSEVVLRALVRWGLVAGPKFEARSQDPK